VVAGKRERRVMEGRFEGMGPKGTGGEFCVKLRPGNQPFDKNAQTTHGGKERGSKLG